jgi:hypothetical protein
MSSPRMLGATRSRAVHRGLCAMLPRCCAYRVGSHSQAHAFRVISLKVIWGKWLQAVQHNKAPRPHTHHDWLVSVASAYGPGPPAATSASGLGTVMRQRANASAIPALETPWCTRAPLHYTPALSGTRLSGTRLSGTRLSENSAKWDQAKWGQAKWDQAKWEWAKWDRALWDAARTCVALYAGTAVAEGAGLAYALQVGHDARVGTGPPVLHRVAEAPPPRPRLAPPCTALVPPPSAPTATMHHPARTTRGQGRRPAELSGFRVLSELRHQTDTAELEELQAQHTAEVRSSERTRVSSSNAKGEFGYVFHGRAIRVYTFGDKRPCRAGGGTRAARGAASQLFEHRL